MPLEAISLTKSVSYKFRRAQRGYVYTETLLLGVWRCLSTEREASGVTEYGILGWHWTPRKGTEPELLRISPDQPRGRCDGDICNSTLRFRIRRATKSINIFVVSRISQTCGSEIVDFVQHWGNELRSWENSNRNYLWWLLLHYLKFYGNYYNSGKFRTILMRMRFKRSQWC